MEIVSQGKVFLSPDIALSAARRSRDTWKEEKTYVSAVTFRDQKHLGTFHDVDEGHPDGPRLVLRSLDGSDFTDVAFAEIRSVTVLRHLPRLWVDGPRFVAPPSVREGRDMYPWGKGTGFLFPSSRSSSVCASLPMSAECTEKLYDGHCPGIQGGSCLSDRFDLAQHNWSLPLFFLAQR